MKHNINILNFNMKAFAAALVAAGLCGCSDWTDLEALDLSEGMQQTTEEELAAIRAFKQGSHKTVILGMDATASAPTARYQHPESMPDSADYIYIRNLSGGLHQVIAAEIAEVRSQKGTKILADVDYMAVENEWLALQDAKTGAGEAAGTEDEFRTFCREHFTAALDCCNKYGCDGIMASYNGAASSQWAMEGRTEFIKAVMEWFSYNPSRELLVRGTLSQIPNASSAGVEQYDWKKFLDGCKYIIYPIGDASSASELNLAIKRVYRGYDDFPLDRFVVEATVPDPADPVQVGMTPAAAAEYVLADNPDFTILGLCVENAQDDYFIMGNSYINVRRAITVLNTEPSVSTQE